MRIEAIDLFCGAGGLTHGLMQAHVNVRLGVDVDPACKYPFERNNRAQCIIRDIKDISSCEISKHFTTDIDVRLVAGCAPCQTFSTYNQKASLTDTRWWLLREFIRVVKDIQPELVTMENVPGLVEHGVYEEFLFFLKTSGYDVDDSIVCCTDYGIPQKRERLVLIASRLGKIRLLPPEHFRKRSKTVAGAIGKMPKLCAGETCAEDPLHQAAKLSELNLRRIQASVPGGTWRDWPKSLRADCHKKRTGKTYPSVYGRMRWDEPSPTITTQFYGFGNGRFGHPEQNRAITLREGAILQSFPANYKFTAPGEPVHKTVLGRMIGNAVPVRLGYIIGKSFQYHLKESARQT